MAAGSPTATVYTFSGLTCGVTHTVAVDAVDPAGNRSAKRSMSVSTAGCPDLSAPTAPGFLSVSGVTTSTVVLSWIASIDNVGVTGYGLYLGGTRRATVAQPFAYSFSGLQCGTAYTLGIEAYDAAGNVSPRSTVAANTSACADNVAPSAPSFLAISAVTQTGLTFGWTGATDNVGVAGYTVYRNGSQLGQTSATSYPVSGLSCGTSYTLAVEARDAAGNVSAKPSISASTSACPAPPSSSPPPPPSLAALAFVSPTAGTVSGLVAWEVTTPVAVDRIDFKIDGGSTLSTERLSPFMFNGDPDGRLDTSTLANGSHTLIVDGYNAAGTRVATASKTVTVSNSAPPPPPTPPAPTPPPSTPPPSTPPPSTPPPSTPPPPLPAGDGGTTPPSGSSFSCYGADPACYVALTCDTTITSGLQTAITNAAAGNVICLRQSGSPYPSLSTSAVKTGDVTIQPVPGDTVSIGSITVTGGSHLVFTGLTSTGGAFPRGATHTHFTHMTFTAPSEVCTATSCGTGVVANADVTFEHDKFDNIQNGIDEARIRLYGQSGNQTASGFTISDSHFGGTGLNGGWAGCSDGIGMVANVSGVTIGPGNEFDHLQQGNCVSINGAHVDPIQSYIAGPGTTITGNYFHDNGDGSGGLGWFSGAGGATTITNNVFVCTCAYPYPVSIPGTPSALFAHNVIAGGGKLQIGKDNQCDDTTNMVARDNVWVGGGIAIGNLNGCSPGPSGLYTASNNLNCGCSGSNNLSATPVFVGGNKPTSYAGYVLASNSAGYKGASDGQSMGITG